MTKNLLRKGLLAAAAVNVGGVLLFSKGFTNEVVNEADPVVMSNFGLLMILIWGLAYGGAALIKGDIKWLLAAFACEKLAYVIVWVKWLTVNNVSALYDQDFLSGLFYSIYGFNDFVFMMFFIWAFRGQSKIKSKS